ncbi:MAG: hypothetical protein U5N55_12715 [Cypionkella sp.]|nr:hypothetical protein [Cypionkella sp.]
MIYRAEFFEAAAGITNADLIGTTTLTFSTAGILDGAGGIVNADLSGASTLTFATVANMRGQGQLSGASTVIFSPVGSLVASGLISGVSTLVFSPFGSIVAGGQISGASTLTFATSGALNGAALSGGAAFPAFTVSGAMTTGASVSSGSSISFDVYGILAGNSIAPPVVDPIYSAAWMPVLKLDRFGREISKKALQRKTIKAVPVEARREVKAAIERIKETPSDTVDLVALDQMIVDMRAISDSLPAIQSALIAEWQALAYDIAVRAEDERDVELLLLMA